MLKSQPLVLCVAAMLLFASKVHSQLKIGDNPRQLNPSALLEMESNNRGFLLPRMSSAQRDAIFQPANSLLIFNTSSNQIEVNLGTPDSPDWNPTTTSGLTITSQDTARWNRITSSDQLRISATGDTVFLPQGGFLIIPGASQLNHPASPNVRTRPAGRLTSTSILAAGEILNDGGQPVLQRGFVWGSGNNPLLGSTEYTTTTAGSGTGLFSSTLEGLSASNNYYIRAFAINAIDTAYGEILSFTIPALYGQVTDIDGNVYKTVRIGALNWMAENLKTTRFANGDTLIHAQSQQEWYNNRRGTTYANYDYRIANDSIFGKLYTFYVAEDIRNICPSEWHVPSIDELYLMFNAPEVTGQSAHLRAVETLENGGYWFSPNYDVTNQSGFTALPGGGITDGGSSTGKNMHAIFWTKTRADWASFFYSISNSPGHESGGLRTDGSAGYSIRCVQDY